MTLAVLTPASLGHSGHALFVSIETQLIYLAVLAALICIWAAIAPQRSNVLLPLSALLGAAAFLGFGASDAPILRGRRRDPDEFKRTNLPEPSKADRFDFGQCADIKIQ